MVIYPAIGGIVVVVVDVMAIEKFNATEEMICT
jgi:hypothetical protein